MNKEHYMIIQEEGAGKKSEQNESRPADQILHLPMMMNARVSKTNSSILLDAPLRTSFNFNTI